VTLREPLVVRARVLWPVRLHIAPDTGLGSSAPLGGGLTKSARLALRRQSNRRTSAFAVRGCVRGRAILARAIDRLVGAAA
jgi:hypothetical protein